jgi:hypothetical protein
VNKNNRKSPTELLFNEKVKGSKNQRIKEIQNVWRNVRGNKKDKIQSKRSDKGKVCVFAGYDVNHADDVYRLLNLTSKHIIKSRDVVWLGKSDGDWQRSKVSSNFKDDNSDNETDNLKNQSKEETTSVDTSKDEKTARALKETPKLKSWFNPNPTRFLENEDSGGELIVERADVVLNLIEKSQEPEAFEEAYYHSNPEDRIKWRDATSKKLQEMKEKGVYEKMCKSALPNGCTCIKNQ